MLTFGTPTEVASVQAKGTKLLVTTTNTERVDSGGTQLGHGTGTSTLVESLLLEVSLAATGSSALVSAITRDAYEVKSNIRN